MSVLSSEKIYEELHHDLLLIPNIVDEKTPEGLNENDNKIIKEYGQITDKGFKILDHVNLMENKDLLNYDQAIKLSGSRFSVLKSDLACLNRALVNFFIDHNVSEYGYIECVIPELVKSSSLEGQVSFEI